jgi:DNA-binding MarR family transcriptional regulator/N-acetylglutamate synthase-like GNAT family acetyltransferase
MGDPDLYRRIEAVRRFNRFYTQQIGVLQERLLRSPFSLAEARLIYELAHRGETTATELSTQLGLDAGYLSRLLQSLKRRGLIERQVCRTDSRQNLLSLKEKGKKAFATIHVRSRNEIGGMLNPLSPSDQNRLVKAMGTIEELLGARPEEKAPYLLRPHQPGDMGWVVHRHGVIYSEEYRWDEQFEALVAGIVSKFIQKYNPKKERCWMAEREGEIVGSVFLVRKSNRTAKLRLLLVEPKARGLGIGSRLVDECVRFARLAGYRKIVLWTNHVLHAARHIYEKAGFRLIQEEPHHSFGHDLIGETWELVLRKAGRWTV